MNASAIRRRALAVGLLALLTAAPAGAQTAVPARSAPPSSSSMSAQERRQAMRVTGLRNIQSRLAGRIEPPEMAGMPVQAALAWWRDATGVNLLVNWRQLEAQGVNIDAPITLKLSSTPAHIVLRVILDQAGHETVSLMTEVTPWFVRVVTDAQARQNVVTKIYDVGDLLHVMPNFTQAPRDLGAALPSVGGGAGGGQTGRSGGGGGGGAGGASLGSVVDTSREERGEQLAQLIRTMIEPDIWQANGGEFASIQFWQNRLIIRAPAYVHEQIGGPALLHEPSARRPRIPMYLRPIPLDDQGRPVLRPDAGAPGQRISRVRQVKDPPVSAKQKPATP